MKEEIELPPLAPFNHIGFKECAVAPTGRASCFVCSEKIAVGSMRLQYRKKESNQMSDIRYVHMGCANNVPVVSRAADIIFARRQLAEPCSPEKRGVLQALLESIS